MAASLEQMQADFDQASAEGDEELMGVIASHIKTAKTAPTAPKGRNAVLVDEARSAAAGLARIPVGMGQLVNLADNATFKLGATPEEYKSGADALLNQIRGREYDPKGPILSRAGERIPEMVGGMFLGAPSKAAGIWQTLRAAAANAGIGAATYYDDAEKLSQKMGSVALASLAGVGFAGVLNTLPGGAHKGAQWLLGRYMKDPDLAQQAAIKDLEAQFPEMASYLTLGQRSGSKAMAETEGRAAGQYAQRAYRAQAETLETALKKYGERYGPNWNPEEAGAQMARRGMTAVRNEASGLAAVRKAEWDAMIGSAEAAVTARKIAGAGVEGSEQVMFNAPDLNLALTELTESYGISKANLAPAIQKLRSQMEVFDGQIPMETLLEVLRKTNAETFNPIMGQVSDDTQRAFGKQFRTALFKAIDDAPDGTSDALSWVKRARQSWSQRSSDLDTFRGSVVAKTLGLDGATPDPSKAMERIVNSSPSEQAKFRHILDKHDPQLLNEVRSMVWKKAMDGATNLKGPHAEASFDPVAAASTILKTIGTEGDELSGLFSKAESAQMRAALEPIRAIAYSKEFASRNAELENIAMTAAGAIASPAAATPFVARNAFRILGMRMFDKMLFTQAGRDKIMATYQAAGTPKFDAMVGRLIASATEDMQLEPRDDTDQ